MKYATIDTAAPPFTAAELNATADFLEATPAWVEAALAGLSERQLRWKPRPEPDAFSAVENICHLRDIEIEGYARRLRRTLEEDHPFLPDIAGARLAVERAYNQQPLGPALAEFAAARRENIALLRSVTPDKLARAAEMQGTGCVSLQQIVEMWKNHDAGHRAELEELVQALRNR
ncbi:MAG: DinB family protein [Candidatus Acidiferrales bacterium]